MSDTPPREISPPSPPASEGWEEKRDARRILLAKVRARRRLMVERDRARAGATHPRPDPAEDESSR